MPRYTLTAIKSGTDPIAPLPPAAFHRTLEEPIYCPRCEATYFLLADYDWATGRHFEDESRRHVALLRKTITLGHAYDHHITHFETNGVVVTRHTKPEAPALEKLKPLTELPQ